MPSAQLTFLCNQRRNHRERTERCDPTATEPLPDVGRWNRGKNRQAEIHKKVFAMVREESCDIRGYSWCVLQTLGPRENRVLRCARAGEYYTRGI